MTATELKELRALVAALRAERARNSELREALQELCDSNQQHRNVPADWGRLDRALDSARALLVSEPEDGD